MAAMWTRVAAVVALCAVGAAALGCMDDNGNSVDWSIMMKVPKISGNSNPNVPEGLAYLYMDGNTTFELSPKSLQQNQDAAAYTLSQLYGADTGSVGWVIYNDEGTSGPTCGWCGHTKGVLGFDQSGAFWLIHSVPQYPPAVNGGGQYAYPDSGEDYGQSFLCVSLPFSAINDVARQMLYTAPNVYDSNLPSALASALPGVNAVILKQHITVSNSSIHEFTSVGGNSFTHFGKTAAWNQDLYESLIAPALQDGLYVETWMRPKMASFCPPQYAYPVMDVNEVTLWPGIAFKESKDHSKWAVSTSTGYVCIGDINHQPSQFARAGGSMCFSFSTAAYQLFSAFVTDADKC